MERSPRTLSAMAIAERSIGAIPGRSGGVCRSPSRRRRRGPLEHRRRAGLGTGRTRTGQPCGTATPAAVPRCAGLPACRSGAGHRALTWFLSSWSGWPSGGTSGAGRRGRLRSPGSSVPLVRSVARWSVPDARPRGQLPGAPPPVLLPPAGWARLLPRKSPAWGTPVLRVL